MEFHKEFLCVGKIQSKEVNVNESKKILIWFRKDIFCFLLKFFDESREYLFSFSSRYVFFTTLPCLTIRRHPDCTTCIRQWKCLYIYAQCPMCSHHYVKGVPYVECMQWLSIHLLLPHLPHCPSKIRQCV